MFGKKGLVVWLMLVALLPLQAQGFRVSVESPATLRQAFSLLIFDRHATPTAMADSMPRRVKARMENDIATFSDSVAEAVYAELRHPDVRQPLGFFIENSDILIKYNPSNPNASHITGSRTNALMRYQLETCGADPSPADCLLHFVAENPASPVAAYLAEHLLTAEADSTTLTTLCSTLEGPAQLCYHYGRLLHRLERQRLLAVGAPLPHFDYTGSDGKATPIDTLLQDSCYHLLIASATWCSQCQDVEQTLRESYPGLKPVVLQLDREKSGWDAPFMQALDVDHIPYLVLLDPQRRIVARDIRIWELKKHLQP